VVAAINVSAAVRRGTAEDILADLLHALLSTAEDIGADVGRLRP
jgi:DNA-binding IclR family transcriptional regulator